jgi:hypothetical protein
MRGQLLGPLRPLGGNDDPFFGEKVLAQLGHGKSLQLLLSARCNLVWSGELSAVARWQGNSDGPEVIILSLLACLLPGIGSWCCRLL